MTGVSEYSPAEIRFILEAARSGDTKKAIAGKCNQRFKRKEWTETHTRYVWNKYKSYPQYAEGAPSDVDQMEMFAPKPGRKAKKSTPAVNNPGGLHVGPQTPNNHEGLGSGYTPSQSQPPSEARVYTAYLYQRARQFQQMLNACSQHLVPQSAGQFQQLLKSSPPISQYSLHQDDFDRITKPHGPQPQEMLALATSSIQPQVAPRAQMFIGPDGQQHFYDPLPLSQTPTTRRNSNLPYQSLPSQQPEVQYMALSHPNPSVPGGMVSENATLYDPAFSPPQSSSSAVSMNPNQPVNDGTAANVYNPQLLSELYQTQQYGHTPILQANPTIQNSMNALMDNPTAQSTSPSTEINVPMVEANSTTEINVPMVEANSTSDDIFDSLPDLPSSCFLAAPSPASDALIDHPVAQFTSPSTEMNVPMVETNSTTEINVPMVKANSTSDDIFDSLLDLPFSCLPAAPSPASDALMDNPTAHSTSPSADEYSTFEDIFDSLPDLPFSCLFAAPSLASDALIDYPVAQHTSDSTETSMDTPIAEEYSTFEDIFDSYILTLPSSSHLPAPSPAPDALVDHPVAQYTPPSTEASMNAPVAEAHSTSEDALDPLSAPPSSSLLRPTDATLKRKSSSPSEPAPKRPRVNDPGQILDTETAVRDTSPAASSTVASPVAATASDIMTRSSTPVSPIDEKEKEGCNAAYECATTVNKVVETSEADWRIADRLYGMDLRQKWNDEVQPVDPAVLDWIDSLREVPIIRGGLSEDEIMRLANEPW